MIEWIEKAGWQNPTPYGSQIAFLKGQHILFFDPATKSLVITGNIGGLKNIGDAKQIDYLYMGNSIHATDQLIEFMKENNI